VVDAPNNDFDPQPTVPVAEDKPASFLSSTLGKVILGVAVVVVALVAIGALVWMAFFNSPSPNVATQPVTHIVATGASASSTGSAPAVAADPITDPPEKPLESTFTFRNIFAPTVKKPTPDSVIASLTAPVVATPSSSSSTKSSSSAASNILSKVDKDTLYLVSIQTVDSQKTATFVWNGSLYTLNEGDAIADTPWKVVSIGDTSVVMLYGDTQVTLTTGQGLSK
jgi:type IV pilus biogenesis protein PilP